MNTSELVVVQEKHSEQNPFQTLQTEVVYIRQFKQKRADHSHQQVTKNDKRQKPKIADHKMGEIQTF